MAKKKKEKVVDLKPDSISEDQLNRLQGIVQALNKLKTDIGQIEVQKHNILHAIAEGNDKLSELQEELKKEYGDDIDVNINDGSIRRREDEPSNS